MPTYSYSVKFEVTIRVYSLNSPEEKLLMMISPNLALFREYKVEEIVNVDNTSMLPDEKFIEILKDVIDKGLKESFVKNNDIHAEILSTKYIGITNLKTKE